MRAFAQDRFDLILMDCEMPEMDGFQATTRIRETERLMNELPENKDNPKHIPIIAVTSYALSGDKAKAVAAGCDGYVTKPFSPRQILAQIRHFLT